MRKKLNHINTNVMTSILGTSNFCRDDVFTDLIRVNGYKQYEPITFALFANKSSYKKNLLEFLEGIIIHEELDIELDEELYDEDFEIIKKYTHKDFWDFRIMLYNKGLINIKEKTKTNKKHVTFVSDTSLNKFLNDLPTDNIKHKANIIIQEALKHEEDNVYKFFSCEENDPNSVINYKKEIFSCDSLLNRLFNIKDDGTGKGEVLMAFLYLDSKINGTSESFDCLFGDGKRNELKSPFNGGSWRLGTNAGIGIFDFWKQILESLNVLTNLSAQLGLSYLEKNLSYEFFELCKQFLDLNLDISKGELNASKISLIELWCFMAHVETCNFDDNAAGIVQDIFTKEYKCSYGFVNDKKEIINAMRSLTYVKDPLKFKTDIQNEIRKCFEHIDNLIIFDEKNNSINVYTSEEASNNIVMESISQNSLKVIEKKLKPKPDTYKEDAFTMWNDNKELNYYDLYTNIKNSC